MDGRLFRRALLASALGMGVWAGLARADGPLLPVPAAAPAPSVVIVNGMIYTNTGVAAPAAPTVAVPTASAVAPAAHACTSMPAEAAPAAPIEAANHPVLATLSNLPHPVRDYWQNHPPLGCWTHFDNYGCSSLPAEFSLFFGSCRTFYGESCAKGPPPPAYPGEQPRRNIAPNCPNCKLP